MATTEQRNEIIKKQLELRKHLWPNLQEDQLWHRKRSDGFITIPRLMPLILQIMDDMSKNKPVSSTYLELWCRSYDLSIVTLTKQNELAFHAGFKGQRALSTWKDRLKILHALGFIDIQPGPNGPMSYVLLWNTYQVIKKLHTKKQPGLSQDAYNALAARAIEIKARDLA
jgi:hypothetical protein